MNGAAVPCVSDDAKPTCLWPEAEPAKQLEHFLPGLSGSRMIISRAVGHT